MRNHLHSKRHVDVIDDEIEVRARTHKNEEDGAKGMIGKLSALRARIRFETPPLEVAPKTCALPLVSQPTICLNHAILGCRSSKTNDECHRAANVELDSPV